MKKIVPIVAFLTDFGAADYYVAAMKGVILSALPHVKFVDITHEVPAQDVRWGAFQLFSVFRNFPKGTLFLCVVDPGVGTDRKIIFAEAGGYWFVGPDNGILSWALEAANAKSVAAFERRPFMATISKTFHGRDIMAPLAAQILLGKNPGKLGVRQNHWVKIPIPSIRKTGSKWVGEILGVDGYGNMITSFKAKEVVAFAKDAKLWFEVGSRRPTIRGLSESYSAAPQGRPLAIEGSSGLIEISVRDGSAAQLFALKPGDAIKLFFRI